MTRTPRPGPYKPEPLATNAIDLPPALDSLLEQLATHVHDVWARQRLADGWRYGPSRDDNQKTHPGLVCYADLTESEKDYDRATARETLKAIVLLGYQIERR